MKHIFLIAALYLSAAPASSAAQMCPPQPSASKDAELEYLERSKDHTAGNEVCIDTALRHLIYYKDDPRTVPILIYYLDFPTPGRLIGAYHAQMPEMDKFPAIYSLAMIGQAAGPELTRFLLHEKVDSLKESNALKAYMDAYGVDPLVAIKNLQSAEDGERLEISKRRHNLASQAAGLCRSDVREQCLSAVSEFK